MIRTDVSLRHSVRNSDGAVEEANQTFKLTSFLDLLSQTQKMRVARIAFQIAGISQQIP